MDIEPNSRCKSDRIANILRERLEQGLWDKKKPLPSTRILAQEFMVATRTADRAIRKLVAEGLLTRVPGQGTWLRRYKQKYRIACMVQTNLSRIMPEMYSDRPLLISYLFEALEQAQCDYDFFSLNDLRKNNFSNRLFDRYDGLMVEHGYSDSNSLQLVNSFKRPKAWLFSNGLLPGNHVTEDFISGFVELLTLARRSGIRRVKLRIAENIAEWIFDKALQMSGWQPDEFVKVKHPHIPNQLFSYKIGLNLENEPRLLHLCSSDMLACGITEAFLDRGFKFGEFAVSGVGDIESLGFLPFNEPRITTISADRRQAIHQTVELLLDHLRSDRKNDVIIRYPAKLVVRASAFGPVPEQVNIKSNNIRSSKV